MDKRSSRADANKMSVGMGFGKTKKCEGEVTVETPPHGWQMCDEARD